MKLDIVRSEQYNDINAVKETLNKFQCKPLGKRDGKIYYQSLNTGFILVLAKFGYLYKLDYYKSCGVCGG